MRVLLDTHALIWTFQDELDRMSVLAEQLITNSSNQILYSTVAPWEVQIKHMTRPDQMFIDAYRFIELCQESGFESLPVTNEAVLQLSTLSRLEGSAPHNDPFDRIMICQAKANDLVFLTHDMRLDDYNEPCVLCV